MLLVTRNTDHCPRCGSTYISRSHVRYYDWLLILIAKPYRCTDCGKRFYRIRSKRKDREREV